VASSFQPSKILSIQSRHQAITASHFDSSENRYLLAGCERGGIFIHDCEVPRFCYGMFRCPEVASCQGSSSATGVPTHAQSSHSAAVSSLAWFPFDTGSFFSGSADRCIRFWDTNTLATVSSVSCSGSVTRICMSSVPSSKRLLAAACGDFQVHLFDARTHSLAMSLTRHDSCVLTLDWSPYSPNILSSAAQDGSLRLWDIRKGIPLACFDMHSAVSHSSGVAHEGPIHSVRFSPCGSFIFSLGADRRLRKWHAFSASNSDVHFTIPRDEISAHFCESMSIFEDFVLFVSYGRNVASFACDSGCLLSLLDPHYGHVTSVCANLSENFLFTSDAAGSLRVWQPVASNHYHGPVDFKTPTS
jgi:WD40 repeat protein